MATKAKTAAQLEVSVDQASKILGVSERMVLNYIKAKRIKALRVGKRWFVDQVSLEAFRQESGLAKRSEAAISATSEISEISEPVVAKTSPPPPAANKSRAESKPAGKSLDRLACFRLCVEAFQMPMWTEANQLRFAQRLRDLQAAILEQLGAGYYAYGADKRGHYDRSRSLIGSALALVYSDTEARRHWASDIAFLERDVLPAFAALIKKIERGQYRQSRERRYDS